MMVLAFSRLMRKSLMGWFSVDLRGQPDRKSAAGKAALHAICRRMTTNPAKRKLSWSAAARAGWSWRPGWARHFGREKFDIILVEKNRTHIWKPLLHEVAAGSLDANLDEVGYRSHGHAWGYRFFYGAMEGIDRDSRQVLIAPILDEDGREIMGRHRIRYDYLVLAVGSVSNDFGTKGVAQHCIFLDSRLQADRFRSKLLDHCLRVSRTLQADPGGRRRGAGGYCRRRRHRRGAGGRALQCGVGAAPLRPGSVRRKPVESDPDRSGPAHPAGAAGKTGGSGAQGTGSAWVCASSPANRWWKPPPKACSPNPAS